ncbi:MAG: hypothetical protein JW910_23660 [Anaerolineae bacterium]|nr:hypothetical protein [Anaerolineae bacterium]
MTGQSATAEQAAARRRWSVLGRWREAWDHALAVYFRAQVGAGMTPWLGALGIMLVWGLALGGTALLVLAYPQAVDVVCDQQTNTCTYPMLAAEPFATFGSIHAALTGEFPWLYMLAAVTFFLASGLPLRSGKRSRPIPSNHWRNRPLGQAWKTGTIETLLITPPGGDGLMRILLLTRLYPLWQRRDLLVMVAGMWAGVLVGYHVIVPVFWWLGPWGNWGMLLLLTLLLCGLGLVVHVNTTTHLLLNEALTMSGERGGMWRLLYFASVVFELLVIFAMFITPLMLVLVTTDLNDVVVPLAMLVALLAIGLALTGFALVYYVAAQMTLRIRRQTDLHA